MKIRRLYLALAIAVAVYMIPNAGQAASSTGQAVGAVNQNRVIGSVDSIDAGGNRLTVKTDDGRSVSVILDATTNYLRVPPGETTLQKAVKISLSDLASGDRVYVRGKLREDGKTLPARAVIVMTHADISRKQEHDRAEWRQRGIFGVISALNPETKEITITSRSRAGANPVIIAANGSGVVFRRYAPDSVRFSDALPSSFAELQVGDQVRALGQKSADSTRFTPEEIVSGSFQTVMGTVMSVNAQTSEIKMKDVRSGQPFTVVVNKDSLVRAIPPEFAAMLAMRASGGNMSQGTRPQDGGNSAGSGGSGNAQAGQGGQPGRFSGGGGRRFGGGPDMADMLERLPPENFADLKPGAFIVVSSTKGAQESRLTAIALVSGLDALLPMVQARARGRAAGGGVGASGMGGDTTFSGIPEIGIGLP